MDPPLIRLINSKNDEKLYKDCDKIKLHRDTMSQKSDLYELKMVLFDNGEPEEFLLFIRNFNITLEASGTLLSGANILLLDILIRIPYIYMQYSIEKISKMIP